MQVPYIIDSFRGGISDENNRGIRGSFKFGYGLDIHKRRDSLSCLYAMSNIVDSSVTTDLIRFAVTGIDGSTYGFGDTGRIYSIAGHTTDPVDNFIVADANGTVKGASAWTYYGAQSTAAYLVWTTNTSVARKSLPADAGWGNEEVNFKTILTASDWHPVKPAGGRLCIGNKENLATLDIEGSFAIDAMNIRPGNNIKAIEEKDDYVILGSEREDEAEEGHIWSWITTALNWVQKKRIPAKGVNSLVDAELLYMQAGASGEIWSSDFVNSVPLVSVPDGGQSNPGGSSIFDDRAVFGIYGTREDLNPGIYSYGRKMKDRPFVLGYDYRLTRNVANSIVSEIGAVWTAHNALFASWKTTDGSTTEYGVDMVSTTTRASARYEGLEFTGGSPHLKKHFTSAKVVMEPLPSGTSVSLLWKPNRTTTGGDSSAGAGWRYARAGGGSSTTYSTADSTEAEFVINDEARVFEIGVELNPSGSDTPEITAIIPYIERETKQY